MTVQAHVRQLLTLVAGSLFATQDVTTVDDDDDGCDVLSDVATITTSEMTTSDVVTIDADLATGYSGNETQSTIDLHTDNEYLGILISQGGTKHRAWNS